jgi:calcium/calmodulin-dependent protein kinase (CaM kinase) II
MSTTADELIALNQKLLESIVQSDWGTYQGLCDPSITCFEPEALGQLVAGLEFHKFYFDLPGGGGKRNVTMCSPSVRIVGDLAVLAYVRLTQVVKAEGPATHAALETRVWQRQEGKWRHVHFHRSPM